MKLSSFLNQLFAVSLLSAAILWILRGVGILTFIPGGIIITFILSAIAIGLLQLSQSRF